MRTDRNSTDRVLLDRPAPGRSPAPPPPGWYRDPCDTDKKRYWDGAFWHDFTTPAARLPQLPLSTAGRPSSPPPKLVYEIDPGRLRRPRWTAGRVASFAAVVLLGSVGWAAIVAGIAHLVTGGAANTPAVWAVGGVMVLAWIVLAALLFPNAPGRTWRLVRIEWLPLLALLAVAIAVTIANMIVP